MGTAFEQARAADSKWVPPTRPRLRRDLEIERTKEGEAVLYKLRAPGAQSVCLLHDVEFLVAQFMDGRRDLEAIVEAGHASGLPMTLDQLHKFIRELAAYGFIDNAAPLPSFGRAAAEPAPPEPPPQVPEHASARHLLQAGLTLLKHGAHQHAIQTFREVLKHEPGHPEASTLLEILARGHLPSPGTSAEPEGSEPAAEPSERRALDIRPARVGPTWKAFRPRWRLDRRGALGLGFGGACALLVASLALVTRPVRLSTSTHLSAPLRRTVVAPQAGPLRDFSVRPGQPVRRGELLGRIEAPGLEAEARKAREHFDRLAQMLAVLEKPVDAAELNALKEKARKLWSRLDVLKRRRNRARERAATERELNRVMGELSVRDLATRPGALGQKRSELDQARERSDSLAKALEALELRAPADGVVTRARAPEREGSPAEAGELLVEVAETSSLTAELRVRGLSEGDLRAGDKALFRAAAGRVEGSAAEVMAEEGAHRLKVVFPNPDGALLPGVEGELQVIGAPRSLWSALTRRIRVEGN